VNQKQSKSRSQPIRRVFFGDFEWYFGILNVHPTCIPDWPVEMARGGAHLSYAEDVVGSKPLLNDKTGQFFFGWGL